MAARLVICARTNCRGVYDINNAPTKKHPKLGTYLRVCPHCGCWGVFMEPTENPSSAIIEDIKKIDVQYVVDRYLENQMYWDSYPFNLNKFLMSVYQHWWLNKHQANDPLYRDLGFYECIGVAQRGYVQIEEVLKSLHDEHSLKKLYLSLIE